MSGPRLTSSSRWVSLHRWIGLLLAVSLCLGTVTLPGVWAATYYVNDDTGNDAYTATQAQSKATPWKTISRAIGEATLAPGDVISVAVGTYDEALGENFPLHLVNGVEIRGAPGATTIRGPAGSALFLNANTALASGSTLSGFTLTHEAGSPANVGMSFDVASAGMAPQILGNSFVGFPVNDIGINIADSGSGVRSFTGTIKGNSFSDLWKAVYGYFTFTGTPADLSPVIQDNSFSGSHWAVDLEVGQAYEGTSSPVIADNQITGSTSTDIYLEMDLWSGHGASMTPLITGNTLSGSAYYGIRLSMNSAEMSSSADVSTFSPTILNNTITDASADGIELDYEDPAGYGTFISDMTIAGNTITNAGSAGINFSYSTLAYTCTHDLDMTIANNTITGADRGVSIEISSTASYVDGSIDITVSGNTITSPNWQGIAVDVSSMYSTCVFDLWTTVQGNVVTGTNEGVSLEISYQEGFNSSHTDVLDNVIDGSSQDGLVLSIEEFPSPTSYVQVACNTITNSTRNSVWLQNDADAPPPDFGGGDLGSPGLNSFTGAGTADFYNDEADPVDAHSNWWGYTDGQLIDDHIYDDDELGTGAVQYSGWLSGPPSVSATATLVDALHNDLSPPGPSYGDTIRYTATLQGTGDCGCAAAVFTVPIPSNGVYIPDSLTASRGIVINDTVSSLHPELIVGLGALEASETVTFTWDVIAGDGCSLVSQATLSCHQLGDLLTDDPDVAGSADPTVIILEHLFCDGFESGDTMLWSNAVP